MKKKKTEAGADQATPSIPQYFSWINNTNEGSTEEQTLVNLDFFDYMYRTFGMQIKIYAWDAGNFDGSREHYGKNDADKLKKQYPNGYKPIVDRANQLGIRLGLWGSPDGYGYDEETQNERFNFFVHLCRDYHFAEFKLDGVCGQLRKEKASVFAEMLKKCRKYSPDLVVLNHRLNLYEAEKYVTTFLFNGDETYVDILNHNNKTAMHNRQFMFTRGHVDGLNRLAEDHGVCISSCIDYFEDELIYQAFSRCLILAPEIYGNPWLMRDDELPKLARVFNLHRRNADILVNGKLLPDSYGCNAIVRGSKTKKFICTGNDSWNIKTIRVVISELGIETDSKVVVNIHHPFEKQIGKFTLDDYVDIELLPFRATLIEVSTIDDSEIMIENCEYEIIKEEYDGTPIEIKLFNGCTDLCKTVPAYKETAPIKLGDLNNIELYPSNAEFLYETACFAINNDSLERRSANRAGESSIPEVKAARNAFFNQERYRLRGCDNSFMFDNNPDTFFDASTREYRGEELRLNGGCLRIDFGEEISADSVEITFFASEKITDEVIPNKIPSLADFSTDLKSWKQTVLKSVENLGDFTARIVRFNVHDIYELGGKKMKAVYPINENIRYLRIPDPMDRIYSVKLINDGEYIALKSPKANNMQSPYRYKNIEAVKSAEFILPKITVPSKICVAINGNHGSESVYCVAQSEDNTYGFPMRAPEYVANMWEHIVCTVDNNYTYYLPVDSAMSGKKIKVSALFVDKSKTDINCEVYLCNCH